MTRRWELQPARRTATPVTLALLGPSGSGKTFSALRLAAGIQRVMPGPIHVIDTEAGRALHYADRWAYEHLPFGAPFSPADYLDAIEHCVSKGARTIVVDSMSHEHEGEGGILEWHDRILDETCKDDGERARKSAQAWIVPKAARRRLINRIIQLGCNFIGCWRAQEKLDWKNKEKGQPREQGFQPVGAKAWIFEMTAGLLLPPGSDGRPCLDPPHQDERALVKVPIQFRDILTPGVQLTEEVGEAMARWATGGAVAPERAAPRERPAASPFDTARASLAECRTREALARWSARVRDSKNLSDAEREALATDYDAARDRIEGGA